MPGRPRIDDSEKAHYNDIITCDICGKSFTRSNRNSHKLTQFHKTYANLNKISRDLVLGKNVQLSKIHKDNIMRKLKEV
jgi:hypothetical protein